MEPCRREQAPADVGEIVKMGVVNVVEGLLYAQLSNGWVWSSGILIRG